MPDYHDGMARANSSGRAAGTWIAAGTLALLLVPGGCRPPAPTSAQPGSAPVRIAVGYGGPANSPGMAIPAFAYLMASEKLVQARRDGRMEAGLAERWEQSDDGLIWRFFIRANLTFHDGSPLDAPVIASRLQVMLQQQPRIPGFRDIVEIRADDPRTLVFVLRRPSGLLLDSLSLSPIWRDDREEIGAGPFRRVPGQAAFEAFPAYYRGRPTVDRVDFKLYPNARNAWAAMMRGELDMLHEVSPEALDFIEQSSSIQVRSFLRPYMLTMNLNLRRPVLQSREVRLALNYAVNRTAIISQVFRGRAYPATDHIFPRHWAYDHTIPRLRYDPAEAIRLLDAQGLRLPPPTRTSGRADTPSRFRFTCIIPAHEMRYERIALMLQRQLLEVGIDMQLEPVTPAELGRRAFTGEFDAFLVDLIATTALDRLYQIWHSPESRAEYFDPGYRSADEALDRLLIARNDQEIRAAVHELQHVMRSDPPAVFLLWSETARAVNARVHPPLTPDRDIYATVARWQVATPSSQPASTP